MAESPKLTLAECYYIVARDLESNAREQLRLAEQLNRHADVLCEQNIRETSPPQQKGDE